MTRSAMETILNIFYDKISLMELDILDRKNTNNTTNNIGIKPLNFRRNHVTSNHFKYVDRYL